MQSLSPHKQGDTFSLLYSLPLAFANVIDTIALQLRLNDSASTLVQQITVTQIDDTATDGQWMLTATAEQTALWPLKLLIGDIKHITADGTVIHSETFKISILKAQTS